MFQGDAFTLTALMLIVISPAIGSFAAVLVDRLVRGEDVVLARSRCRSCQTRLTARDLIPLLSFLRQLGCCRHCGAAIPRWVLAMELAALALALIVVALWAPYADQRATPAMMLVDGALLWVLLTLIATDLLWMRLPDLLTAGLLGLALLRALLWAQNPLAPYFPVAVGPQDALIGALCGVASFAALRLGYHRWRGREGLGMGDVKLMAGLGALAGPLDVPLLVLMAALGALGTVAALGLSTMGQHRLQASTALPFGAALAGAGITLWALRLSGG